VPEQIRLAPPTASRKMLCHGAEEKRRQAAALHKTSHNASLDSIGGVVVSWRRTLLADVAACGQVRARQFLNVQFPCPVLI
jgi:hypothetical protein